MEQGEDEFNDGVQGDQGEDRERGEQPLSPVAEARLRIAEFASRSASNSEAEKEGLYPRGLLDLSNLGLTSKSMAELAPALIPLTGLTELRLSENQLTSTRQLADVLRPLHGLTDLILFENQLRSTPDLIAALSPLTGLTTLDLGHNLLTSTPDLVAAIRPLKRLTTLYLDINQLAPTHELAAALWQLTELRKLNIEKNMIPILDRVMEDGTPWEVLRHLDHINNGDARLNPEFKVVILGQGQIGKTQLRHRLMGESPIDDEPMTHSFVWHTVPAQYKLEWPPELRVVWSKQEDDDSGIELEQPNPVLHLFDFGGQEFLWASHRFFFSSRRAIMLICGSRTHSPSQARLAHWLKYVRHTREEECRASASREWRESAMGLNRGGPTLTFEEQLRKEHQETRCPPVVVVLTHSVQRRPFDKAPDPELTKEAKQLRDAAELQRSERPNDTDTLRIALVEDYDSYTDDDGARIKAVRDAITAALHTPEMEQAWTMQWPNYLLERLGSMRTAFGFDMGGLNPAKSRFKMTINEYYDEFCGLQQPGPNGPDNALLAAQKDARDDLRLFRDLGVVHWVGDHPDVVKSRESIENLIFSPAAVRGPIYNVLWSKYKAAGPLTYAEIIKELQNPLEDGSLPPSPDDADLLLRLMVACELVFETPSTTGGLPLYLVPDRLPSGANLTIKNDTPSNAGETVLRADLDFIPDMLMPRLIGKLWKGEHGLAALTRCSCQVDWKHADESYPVRVCADQAAGIFRAALTAPDAVIEAVQAVLIAHLGDILGRGRDPVRLKVVSGPVHDPLAGNPGNAHTIGEGDPPVNPPGRDEVGAHRRLSKLHSFKCLGPDDQELFSTVVYGWVVDRLREQKKELLDLPLRRLVEAFVDSSLEARIVGRSAKGQRACYRMAATLACACDVDVVPESDQLPELMRLNPKHVDTLLQLFGYPQNPEYLNPTEQKSSPAEINPSGRTEMFVDDASICKVYRTVHEKIQMTKKKQ